MKIMSFTIVALLSSSAFAQESVCSQDVECQQSKIEAMGGMEAAAPAEPAPVDVKDLKKEILKLRQLFMKGAMDATEGGVYGGYTKGVDTMDNYLARISLLSKSMTPAAREELQTIRTDVTNISASYGQSNR